MKKLLAGLLAAVLLTAPAFGDDTVWDSLEDRYYEDISRTETDITLRFLEEGDQLDWSRAVRRYHTEDSLLTRSGVDAFLTAVRSGELLSSRISYDERLMVFVEQADGSGGTAVVNPGKGELVGYLPGDEGEMFVMELTGGVKAVLEDSGIDLTRAGLKGSPTKVKRTYVPPRKKSGVMITGETPEECAAKLYEALNSAHVI